MATFTTIADGPLESPSTYWPTLSITHVSDDGAGYGTFIVSTNPVTSLHTGDLFTVSGLTASQYNGTQTVISVGNFSGSYFIAFTSTQSAYDADDSGSAQAQAFPTSTDSIVCAYANTLGGGNLTPVSYTFASLTLSGGGSLVIGNAVAPTTINAAQVTGANTTGYVTLNIGVDISTYVLKSSVVAASYVVTGNSNYPGGSAGTYPTTAATQAADAAIVAAHPEYIVTGQSVLGTEGTGGGGVDYPFMDIMLIP